MSDLRLGFDVTDMAPAELEQHGIRLHSPVFSEAVENRSAKAWMLHSEYDQANPRAEAMDRVYARTMAREHFEASGGLGGLVLLRSFPCLGRLRVDGDEVQCDVCAAVMGLVEEQTEADAEEQPDPVQDDIPF